jgi:putative transposase
MAISDAGWGEFLRQLQYKCEWYGKNYLEVPRFFASSKTCSNCGSLNETLALQDREWHCANCGTYHDRDLNAAKNIKNYFLTHSGEGISGEPVELLPVGRAKKREVY